MTVSAKGTLAASWRRPSAAPGAIRPATRAVLLAAMLAAAFAVMPAVRGEDDAGGSADNAAADKSAADGLLGHWRFAAEHLTGTRLEPLAGELPATLAGGATLSSVAAAVQLDGVRADVVLAETPPATALPSQNMSALAHVVVDAPREWGGILSAIQDNGSYEKGWLLGYRGKRFTFALATKGNAKLTYLTGTTDFAPRRWYHVAGTYDGKVQKLYVDGKLEATSEAQRGPIDYPPRFFYDIGAYHDDDEQFRLQGLVHEVRLYDRCLTAAEVATRAGDAPPPLPAPARLAAGPWSRRLGSGRVEIGWMTDAPQAATLRHGPPGALDRVAGEAEPRGDALREGDSRERSPLHRHAVTIDDVPREGRYAYRIVARGDAVSGNAALRETPPYDFDAAFDYTLPPVAVRPDPYPRDAWTPIYAATAARILEETAIRRGYCLVLGGERGRLAREIALRSELQVVCVEPDADKAAAARRALARAGLYGTRVSVHRRPLAELPYRPYLFNLVVSDALLRTGSLPTEGAAVWRNVRPDGGAICLGRTAAALESTGAGDAPRPTAEQYRAWLGDHANAAFSDTDGLWATAARPPLADAGEWSHQYGDAGNSSCSDDRLVTGDLRLLWFGRPGPRPMPDRGARNPAPLYAGGRLFVLGDRILFGLDAYNGAILWTLDLPTARRANIPRDGSNLVADRDHVYVAAGASCLKIDAARGEILSALRPPAADPAEPPAWGYLARAGDVLLGSSVRPGAPYRGDVGEWYDKGGSDTNKVTADALFAVTAAGAEPVWTYRGGAIVQPTVAVTTKGATGRVFFVESRDAGAVAEAGGRQGDAIYREQFLVALDLSTGEKLWERPVDFGKCRQVFYAAAAGDKLVVCGTSAGYHLYTFDAASGKPLWERNWPWKQDHHGGAMQHPVLRGETAYLEYKAFDLADGTPRRGLPARGHGCGAQTASAGSFFYRGGFHTEWNPVTNRQTELAKARSGCWLGLIPAGGILLAPETSSGCSCTHPIQGSMAFVPAPEE